MGQETFCPHAERLLAAASCVQMLSEAGHKLISVNVTDKDAVISINYTPKTKALEGKASGVTCIKGAYFFVYQKAIAGVLVRWLEPYHDAQLIRRLH